jgi:hypothetical protein
MSMSRHLWVLLATVTTVTPASGYRLLGQATSHYTIT